MLILTKEHLSLDKFLGASAYLEESIALDEFFADLNGFSDIGNGKILQSAIDSSKVVCLSLKLFIGDSLVDVSQILRTDRRTRSSCIVDKLFAGHLFLLFGVVSVSGKHDDCVSQGKELISVVIAVNVALVEGKSKLPNNSLYLLRLTWQSKLAEQRSQSLVELLPCELEQLAIGMQDIQHLFIIFAEVFSQDGLINSFDLDDILGYGIRTVLMNEPLCNVVIDGVLWFLIEHENEQLCLFIEALIFMDVVEFSHEIAVSVLLIESSPLQIQRNRISILHQVVLNLLLELGASLLRLRTQNRQSLVPPSAVLVLNITEFLQFLDLVIIKLYEFGLVWRLKLDFYLCLGNGRTFSVDWGFCADHGPSSLYQIKIDLNLKVEVQSQEVE